MKPGDAGAGSDGRRSCTAPASDCLFKDPLYVLRVVDDDLMISAPLLASCSVGPSPRGSSSMKVMVRSKE